MSARQSALAEHEEASEEARREMRAAFDSKIMRLDRKVDGVDRAILGLTHSVDRMGSVLNTQTEMIKEVYATTYTGAKPLVARVAALEARAKTQPPPASSMKYWLPVSLALLTSVAGIVAAIWGH